MGNAACGDCGGMGYGRVDPDRGFVDDATPCPTCNADGEPREPGWSIPKDPADGSLSVAWIGPPGDPNAPVMTAEQAGFSPDEVAAAAEQSGGGGR